MVVGLKRAMSEDSVVWKKIEGSKWAVGAFWAIPFWWWPSFLWSVRGWKHAQSGGAKQQEWGEDIPLWTLGRRGALARGTIDCRG